MTTKEQERKALEQIKKIVKGLGENSYVATAFEGCFKDAEENIEYDFAMNMKDRWESAERKIEKLAGELDESRKDYEAAHAAAHEIANEKDAEIARLNEEIKALKKRLFSMDELEALSQLAANAQYEADTDAKDAAAAIVEYADNPSSAEFQQAVRKHRDADKRSFRLRDIQERIIRVSTAGA